MATKPEQKQDQSQAAKKNIKTKKVEAILAHIK